MRMNLFIYVARQFLARSWKGSSRSETVIRSIYFANLVYPASFVYLLQNFTIQKYCNKLDGSQNLLR